MSELQPGMLALVVGARYCHENIGKMVEVVSVDDEEVVVQGEGLVGYVEALDTKFLTKKFCALKSHIMPIKPEADPLEIKVNQELHA